MEQQQLGKRGLPVYSKNPSAAAAIQTMKTGIKRISNDKGEEMILSNASTGEIVANAGIGFHQKVKVDKTQFVKLYIQGVSAFVGLSKAGANILEIVITEINKTPSRDIVYLNSRMADELYAIKKSSFMRGIKNLLEKEILYEHIDENLYFININYIFNGDRLAFLKTYEIDRSIEPNIKNKQIDHPNQLTMDLD